MKYINKLLVLILLFLVVIILNKKSASFNTFLHDKVLSNNFNFYKIKSIYNKYLGKVIPIDNAVTVPVFNDVLTYKEIIELDNKIKLITDDAYLVPSIESGIVTFIGDKDNSTNVVIVEGENTIWYENINTSVKLYDKVEKGELVGEVINHTLYLTFKNEGTYLDYKDFI